MRKMQNKMMVLLTMVICLASCNETKKQPRTTVVEPITKPVIKPEKAQKDCGREEQLLCTTDGFSSYTDNIIRGKGVVSFELSLNDRLDIYDEDDAVFGFIVLNEDMNFYTLEMPKKLVARKVITEYDLASFNFDAEEESTNKEYLIIYANGGKRKVKKTQLKYSYTSWNEYFKQQSVALKPCNQLKNLLNGGQGLTFDVIAMDGDRIKIKSSRDCGGEDGIYRPAEGWVKWREKDMMLVDIKICN